MVAWYTKSVDTRVSQMFESIRQYSFQIQMKPRPFITIARQYGCDAYDIADKLADILTEESDRDIAWTVYDKQLVEKVAGDLNATEKMIKTMTVKHRNALEEFLSSMVLKIPNTDKIFKRMVKVIRGIAWHGNSIIVGRGGGIISRDMPGGVHVNLVAPFDWRMSNILRGEAESKSSWVRKELSLRDSERSKFYQKYFEKNLDHFHEFDLTINNARVDLDDTVNLIYKALKQKLAKISTNEVQLV